MTTLQKTKDLFVAWEWLSKLGDLVKLLTDIKLGGVAAVLGMTVVGAQAATIYGILMNESDGSDGGPAANRIVELICPTLRESGRTNEYGAYRFTVNYTGPCDLVSGSATTRIVIYGDPTRYDYTFQTVNGRLTFSRR